MAVGIDITDRARPALLRFMTALNQRNLNPVIGRAAANATQAHLFKLDRQSHNVLGASPGGHKTHFYAKAARATYFSILPESVRVTVAHVGAAQRYYGGTIRPVNAKALTIPACAEAYGFRAGEFNNLVFAKVGGKPALVEADASKISISKKTGKVTKKGAVGGKVYYWLVPSVTQAADPTVLPTNAEYTAAIDSGIKDWLSTQ